MFIVPVEPDVELSVTVVESVDVSEVPPPQAVNAPNTNTNNNFFMLFRFN